MSRRSSSLLRLGRSSGSSGVSLGWAVGGGAGFATGAGGRFAQLWYGVPITDQTDRRPCLGKGLSIDPCGHHRDPHLPLKLLVERRAENDIGFGIDLLA